MKKFQFSLQAVRSWRERQEHQAIEGYAASLRALQEAESRVAAAMAALESARATWSQTLRGGCSALDLLHFQQHDLFLEGRRINCLRDRTQSERLVKVALAAMLAARQKRELVDKLEARLRVRHDLEASREAQRELDDMTGSRRSGNSALSLT